MTIQITIEDPTQPICVELIAELSAELGAMYGDDGSALFTPTDVMVPRAVFVVAWVAGEAVGCGALRPMKHDDTIAEIKRMYVRAAGRGQGLSRKILAKLEAYATEYAYRTIWLETGTRQTAAIGLYESSGYVRMACYGSYADDPLSLCYQKSL